MDLDPSFPLYEDDSGSKPMDSMASPPLDMFFLNQSNFETEHHHYHPCNLDRKKRLQHHLRPLEKCVKEVQYYSPMVEPDHGNTIHPFEGVFGKSACFCGLLSKDFDCPSPFRNAADLSSISETDRSPSPQALSHYGHTLGVDNINTSCHECWDSVHTSYGSVIPRDIQHIHEAAYPEPENSEHQMVSQIYDPCASIYHTQGGILSDLEINDDIDVDADGEPDAVCLHNVDPELTQRISKMPRTKKNSRSHHKREDSTSGVRKYAVPRKAGRSSNNKLSGSKDTSTDSRTYSCSFKMYGCESTFNSKNEWKRHFTSQHLKLNFYRCDLPGCSPFTNRPNDFNRKDLFTQHLRRMHAPWPNKDTPSREKKEEFDRGLERIHKRCLKEKRRPPSLSCCTACNLTFAHWPERMEHMSKHYEEDPHFDEPEDPCLVEWALQEGILCRKGASNDLILTDKRDRDDKSNS